MLTALLTMLLVFSHVETTTTTCPAPTNVQADPIEDGFILDWDNCLCSSFDSYKLQYYRHEDSYTSSVYSTGSSTYTFSNLPNGTYDISVWIDCGTEVGEAIVIEDLVVD